MKKGLFLIFIFSMLYIGLASASYSCADNSTLSEDTKDLDIGESGNANGLFIGLSSAREVIAVSRIEAEIFIDSHTFTLTDNTSVGSELMDGTKFNLTLVSSDENSATVSVNSGNASIDEKNTEVINGYEVFLVSSEGAFPGAASVKLLVGDSKIFIDNKDNSEESLTVNGKKYLITLFSASNENALVRVFKCNNGDSTVQVIADAPPVNNTNNTIVNNTNQTNNNTISNTGGNNNTNNTSNQTNNQIGNNTGNVQDDGAGNDKFDSIVRVAFIIVSAIVVIIFIYLVFRYFKSRSSLRRIEKSNSD